MVASDRCPEAECGEKYRSSGYPKQGLHHRCHIHAACLKKKKYTYNPTKCETCKSWLSAGFFAASPDLEAKKRWLIWRSLIIRLIQKNKKTTTRNLWWKNSKRVVNWRPEITKMDLASAHLSDISAVSFSSSKTPPATSSTTSSNTSQSQISASEEDKESSPIMEQRSDHLEQQQPFLPPIVSTPTHQPL